MTLSSSVVVASFGAAAFVLSSGCGASAPRTAPPPEYERYELPPWEAPGATDSVSDAPASEGAPDIAPIPEPPAAAEGPDPGPEPVEPPSLAPELPEKKPESSGPAQGTPGPY